MGGGGAGGEGGAADDFECSDGNAAGAAGEAADRTRCVARAAMQVTMGSQFVCALLDTGSVRCWGTSSAGQLGYGNTEAIGDDEVPASAGDVPVGGAVRQIAAGRYHHCAVLRNGHVRCWGHNDDGQLGYGNRERIGDVRTPSSAGDVDVGGLVRELAAGAFHNCVLLTSGGVRCWGYAGVGSLGLPGLGNGDYIGDDELPASVGLVDVGGEVVQLTAGELHTCALLANGHVRCWGAGSNGRTGHASLLDTGEHETPASTGDVDVGGTVQQVSAGSDHTCALLSNGAVRCWGDNGTGALGYGHTRDIGDDEVPAAAGDVPLGGTARQISAGTAHTCAVLTSGAVRCWGDNRSGQLGYGHLRAIGDDETPASAGDVPVGGAVQRISAGQGTTCALLTTGQVRCWGSSSFGECGYGNTEQIGDDETPASVGDVPLLSTAAP